MIRKKLFTLIAVFFITNLSYAEQVKINNLTIVVSSCDKYSVLWEPFFEFLFEHWSSLNTYNNIPIILVSNDKNFPNPRVTVIKSGKELGWSGNVEDAVNHVQTKYILYLQEDYFITRKVLEDKILEVINSMEANNLDYVEITEDYFDSLKDEMQEVPGSNLIKLKDHKRGFLTSLQASIWNKQTLKEFLHKEPKDHKIWDFEKIKLQDNHKFAFYTATPKPIYYLNIMKRGAINARAYSWLYYRGFDMNLVNKFPIYGAAYGSKEWLRRNIPLLANIYFYLTGLYVDKVIVQRSFRANSN